MHKENTHLYSRLHVIRLDLPQHTKIFKTSVKSQKWVTKGRRWTLAPWKSCHRQIYEDGKVAGAWLPLGRVWGIRSDCCEVKNSFGEGWKYSKIIKRRRVLAQWVTCCIGLCGRDQLESWPFATQFCTKANPGRQQMMVLALEPLPPTWKMELLDPGFRLAEPQLLQALTKIKDLCFALCFSNFQIKQK